MARVQFGFCLGFVGGVAVVLAVASFLVAPHSSLATGI